MILLGSDCALEILLPCGSVTIVDGDLPGDLMAANWFAVSGRKTKYVMRNVPRGNGRYRKEFLHRAILGVTDRSVLVDHRNHDGLDNRRNNLRQCSQRQNQQNQLPIAGASKFKGVSWHRKSNKWQVRIRTEAKQVYVGIFDTEEAAARAYDAAAIQHFGEFACLNFPSEAVL